MIKRISILAVMFALTACGGGGGGSSSSPTDGTGVTAPVSVDDAHLKAIHADYAADRSITGAGVTVAVIDSGVNANHIEFGGKTLNQHSASFVSPINYYSAQQITDMGISGNDYSDAIQTGAQEDVYGHGTHVTSMVWGENVGVAPGADLLMLDVYPQYSPDVYAAKGLIADLRGYGVSFANVSMTGVDYYESSSRLDERPVFAPLDTDDIGWIVAGGNAALDMTEVFVTNPIDCGTLTSQQRDNTPVCSFVYDATVEKLLVKDTTLKDNVIWVGAIDDATNAISTFKLANGTVAGSNTPGSDPEIQARWISAPGSDITGPFFGNNSEYFQLSGTSQAAPLVTGAAALVKSKFPSLSNAAVLQILLDTADKSFAGYDATLYGQGILDVAAALQINPVDYSTL